MKIKKMNLYDRVLAHNYYPTKHQLVGDANMLNGRKIWYERKSLKVPGYLSHAYNKAMNMLKGARLELSSDPVENRKKSDEERGRR